MEKIRITITCEYEPVLGNYPEHVKTVEQAAAFDQSMYDNGDVDIDDILQDVDSLEVKFEAQ